jgi:hypothetical protein
MINKNKHIISSRSSHLLLQLGAVDFDFRVDTKFFFHSDMLMPLSAKTRDELWVLAVNEKRVFEHDNLNGDDTSSQFFKWHHLEFNNTRQVSGRKLGELGPSLFEWKNKAHPMETEKSKISLDDLGEFQSFVTTQTFFDQTGFSFETRSQKPHIVVFDLEERIGSQMVRFEVLESDYVKTAAKRKIYYRSHIGE